MFKLVDGSHLWHRLWSVRFAILSTVLGVASQVLPMWFPEVSEMHMAAFSTLLAALAGVSSLIKQPKLLDDINAQ